jgi:small-conductance mechanosensitive channel
MAANPLDALVALLVLVAIAVTLRLVWVRVLAGGRAPGVLGRWLAESTATPVFLLVLAGGTQAIFAEIAELPQVRSLPITRYITSATYLLTVAAATWVAYALVKGLSQWYLSRVAPETGSKVDTDLVPLFRRVAQVLLLFTALTVVFDHYNLKLTALLGVAGVASLAGALAAQDTLANMIAGFTIMLDRPFRLGDRVELAGGRTGDVIEIGLRSTRILSPDHTVHIVPNAEIAKSSIVNHSYPDNRVNCRHKVTVAYGNDLQTAKGAVLEACRSQPQVLQDPPPGAVLAELADQSVQIHFNFWINDHRQRGLVLDAILSAIYERFAREGVRAPAPQMEVYLKTPAPPGAA